MSSFGELHNPIKEYINADPTTYCRLSLKGMEILEVTSGRVYEHTQLKKKNPEIINRVFTDTKTGSEYVEIFDYPKEQKLVSLILKGVINVADIILVDEIYVSSVFDINKIDKKSAHHFNADNYILWLLVGDEEHYSDTNLEHNEDWSKYYFFDFGENGFDLEGERQGSKGYMKRLVGNIEGINISDGCYPVDYMHDLISKLHGQYSDNIQEGYIFFKALLKESGIESNEGEEYWNIFINNLKRLQNRVKILKKVGYGI